MIFHFSGQNENLRQAPLESRAIAKAPEGEGCPRCGGYVYAAEQMLALGKVRSLLYCIHLNFLLFSIYISISVTVLRSGTFRKKIFRPNVR